MGVFIVLGINRGVSDKMSQTEELLKLVFGDGLKTAGLRKNALAVVNFLHKNKTANPTELRKIIKSKKGYYKVLTKLKDIGLVQLRRTAEKKVYYDLSPDVFKHNLQQLIRSVVKELA